MQLDRSGLNGDWRKPVATQTPMKREPAEPQGFIKPTGVGIPHLQAGEEVNVDHSDGAHRSV